MRSSSRSFKSCNVKRINVTKSETEPLLTRPDKQGLEILAQVSRLLASAIGSDDVLHETVNLLGQRLPVDGCSIWVRAREGDVFRRLGAGGELHAEIRDPSKWITEAEDRRDVVRLSLIAEGKPLGLLQAEKHPAIPREAASLLETIAHTLALWLSSTELSEDLATEVASRTREIDAQRRFTDRIVDSLPVGLYVVDRDFRIQAWNRKRETGTQGIDREEVIGRDVFAILTRQPRSLLQREFERVFRTGEMEQMDVESTIDGAVRYFRISKIPMRLHDAEITHVITVGEDVTEWKTIQRQIAQTDKLAAVGQLAAGVMHELNNPLATIGACVEALTVRMPDLPPGDQQALDEYLRIVEAELDRCQAIVDGLLDFSHPKAQKKESEAINPIVEDALFLIKHHDNYRGVELVRVLQEDLPPIYANARQLIQVFLTLMLNALDSMEGEGTLTVSSSHNPERDDEIVVAFADTGLGIARDDLHKIFEPFYTTKHPGRGTGLGLSICYAMVQEHRGRILVDSQLGRGSTFKVFLPTARASEQTEQD